MHDIILTGDAYPTGVPLLVSSVGDDTVCGERVLAMVLIMTTC